MSRMGLREAIKSVKKYIVDFNDILDNNLDKAMIEEIELSEDEKSWLITISFERKISSVETEANFGLSALKALVPQNKDYKIFKVDSLTGEVKSMKMYKF